MNPNLGYQNGGFGAAFAFILVLFILIDWLECKGDYDLKLFVEKIYHLIDSSSQTLL